MQSIEDFLTQLSGHLWGPPMLILLSRVIVAETREYLWEGNRDKSIPSVAVETEATTPSDQII